MLYTYCLIGSSYDSLTLPQGLFRNLKLVTKDTIAAIVEPELPIDDIKEDEQQLMEAVLHHDWVICEIFHQMTLLPLRFGTCFRNEQDLETHLETYAHQYQKTLGQLAGKVELTLKLNPLPFSESNSSPTQQRGKAYFLAKKQRYQQQNQYKQQQQDELTSFQQQLTQGYSNFIHGEPQQGTERFYLLIPETDLEGISEQIQQWNNQLKSWTIEVSEPLPPYHFLEIE